MGRPNELSESQREDLLAKGYRPIEVWLPDIWSDDVWAQLEQDCKLMSASEEEADIDLWIEASTETMRIIQEDESRP